MKCSSSRSENVAADDMTASYNRHKQKVDFSKHFGCKQNCGPQDGLENFSVKYFNKSCSPNRTNSGKTIRIIIKTKTKSEQPNKKILKEKITRRVKKTIPPSLITVDDCLKVLAKKCSTPDVLQTYVHEIEKKRRCSDTCLNASTPFKTKTIVHTVSLDPKKIPQNCKNLLNHPLMQAQLSIYRCQLKMEKESGCRTCTSAAIFEVVKCLYDCYKKKKCDPCKCIMCGYLPRDKRKLFNEVGKSSTSIGVETPSPNQTTRSTMTSVEDKLLSILQNDPKPERPKITASEKLRIAKAFGIMTPEVPGFTKSDREAHQIDYMIKIDAPYPDDNAPLGKQLYRTNIPNEGPSLRIPSKKLRKARASGLLTPLDGKTQEQKEKMLRNLAMSNIPLPEGKTESEKIVISKVRRDVGLPPGPRTAAEKQSYAKAQAAGLITPLTGKSQPQKENILRLLLENGIPLPEGRTPAEKAFIEKIELDHLSKAMFRFDTEKTIKSKGRSCVQTLFNKFATETGYMVLVETSCVKHQFHNLQVKGLLTSIEGKVPREEKTKVHTIRPKEAKSVEKALFKEVKSGVRLVPKSQDTTLIGKPLRGAEQECEQLRDGLLSSKKSIKNQPDSRILFEERIKEPKEKLLPCIAIAGNPFLKSKTSLQKLLGRMLEDKARPSNIISERMQNLKRSKLESQQTQVVKHLADARLSLSGDYIPLKRENINHVRYTCQTSDVGTEIPQKVSKGVITNAKAHIKENFDNTLVGAGICERSGCDMTKLSHRKSYLEIKLSLSDISNVSTPRETHSVFTDTRDIKQTRDIAISLPSIRNSKTADETEILDKIPTKEIKNKKNFNSSNDKSQTSLGTNSTTEDIDSESTFYLENDNTDNASRSDGNTCERYFVDNNADLIYIYKPALEVDGNGKLKTSSRIILTDSCDTSIGPTSSGSLYIIETGSTTSYASGMTVLSYATKETSETETATDVYYVKKSEEEYSKDTSSEPRIFWFYRNKVVHNLNGKDAKIYLVSEVKMREERIEPAQRKKPLGFEEHGNNMRNSKIKPEVMQPAQRQSLNRCSSVFIVLSPSNHEEISSEKLGSLIYLGKLDSVSKLKNIKLVPHENTQKVDPIKICRRHARSEEDAIKYSVYPRTELKCSGIRPEPAGHASDALPVTNAFSKYSCNKVTNNRENIMEHPTAQIQKQRIPPKYSEHQKTISGRATWNKELQLEPPSCSTTSRLGSRIPEQRMGYSGTGRKNLELNLNKTKTGCESKGTASIAITRYNYCGKNTSYQEKRNKWFPEQISLNKSSKVCLVSTAHSSRCRVPSKVSFSDKLNIGREKPIEPCKECLDPNPKICPPKNPKARKNTHDGSSSCSYDEKAKNKREKQPQLTITISPQVSSKCNLKSAKSSKGSKVRFDHPLPFCCPCEFPKRDGEKKETTPCDGEKKESKPCEAQKKKCKPCDGDKNKSKPCDSEITESEPRNSEKKESKPCDTEKKESKSCDNERKESKPCDKKKESKPCDNEKEESKACNNEKKESKPCDIEKKESNLCANEKKESKPCDSEKKDLESYDSEKKECKPCCREKKTESKSCDLIKKISDAFGKLMKKVSSESTPCQTAATVQPCEDKTKNYSDQSTAVCPEKDKIPGRRQWESCGPCFNNDIKNSNCEGPTKDSADTRMAPECQTAERNIKVCEQETSKCQVNSIQDSIETDECIKQQMVTEQWCPSNLTSTAQSNDECEKLHQQMASECPENSAQDSVSQPADENIKSGQQTASECQADCSRNPTEEPTTECVKQKLPADDCDDNAKLSQPTDCECPANSTLQPVKEDIKLSQQTASECPAPNLTKDSTEQPECVKQQLVSELPPKSNQDCIQQPAAGNDKLCKNPAPCLVFKRKKKKNKRPAVLPRESRGSECIPKSQMNEYDASCPGQPQPSQVCPDPCLAGSGLIPCTPEQTKQPSDKKNRRLWWCRRKNPASHRRHCRPLPPPPCPVEDRTVETQCERNVRDLAQMTDDLMRMTDSLRELTRGITQCHCGDTAQPCQCLQDLVTKSITSSQATNTKKLSKCECPPPILIIKGQTAEKDNVKEDNSVKLMMDQPLDCPCINYFVKYNIKPCLSKMEQAHSMSSLHASKKVVCECPPRPPLHIAQCTTEVKNETTGRISKKNMRCRCFQPKDVDQNEEDGSCQRMALDEDGKKNIACELLRPAAAGQSGKEGACQGMASEQSVKENIKDQCPRPINIVTEQTTSAQCPKEARDTLDTCQGKETQAQNKKQNVKKTVICESPSKDKQSCQDDRKPTCLKDHKTGCQKKKLSICLGKKRQKAAACSSSDEVTECQDTKSSGVKWCRKKYVITECPPVECDNDRKKQPKKNARNQAKIKTGEKKVDTSCTHCSAPCLCKEDPICQTKKNHTCECPCPAFVEEVDLDLNIKDCSSAPPCPPEVENEIKIQNTCSGECNQSQMTEGKADKCSYTDHPIKDMCKVKNKASGRGKWGRKKIVCFCRPDPPTTETGCDPPCAKEQWKLRSKETHSRSGFSVKKKPAQRVDHTMCFEDALAYFEQHPEDDPMRKKKNKVICECPPLECCDRSGGLQLCYGGSSIPYA